MGDCPLQSATTSAAQGLAVKKIDQLMEPR